MWEHIPADKSLFTNGEDNGLPIGNLLSQMLANFLMDRIDWKTEETGIELHGRYVDDFYLISRDKEKILRAMVIIREALLEIGLTLHPKKFYIQYYAKGIRFTGTIVKPGRTYAGITTVHSFKDSVRELERAKDIEKIRKAVSRVNSYLGTMSHHSTYGIRRKTLTDATIYDKVTVGGKFEKVILRKKYRKETEIREKIRRGEFAELALA